MQQQRRLSSIEPRGRIRTPVPPIIAKHMSSGRRGYRRWDTAGRYSKQVTTGIEVVHRYHGSTITAAKRELLMLLVLLLLLLVLLKLMLHMSVLWSFLTGRGQI